MREETASTHNSGGPTRVRIPAAPGEKMLNRDLSSLQGGLEGKVGKPANSPPDLKPEKSKSAGLNVY